jgi:hypothetical protein
VAEVPVDRLPRLLGDLEPDRPTGLPLADCRAIDRVAVRRNILDPQSDHVTTAKLAVDGDVEEREIAYAACELQPSAYRPDMLRLKRWFRARQSAFVPRRARSLGGGACDEFEVHEVPPLLLKVVGLEMGGKSPFIVLDDARIDDDLIENAAMSAFCLLRRRHQDAVRWLQALRIAGP